MRLLSSAPAAYTVGHGTLSAEEFVALLQGAKIAAIADVRIVPRSRHNPQFGLENISRTLVTAGIAYEHFKELGGWRRPAHDSPNVALRNVAFRGYADYMQTDEFARAVDALVVELAARPTAVMCSESLWWRCHRRLLADYLVLARGWRIYDLLHDGRLDEHRLTPGIRRTARGVQYDAPAGPLFGSSR